MTNDYVDPSDPNGPPRCDLCVHALLWDYGYSDYTVEGTNVICMQKLHPDPEFDRFYGPAAKLKFAEQCPQFAPGQVDYLNVDYDDELVNQLSEEGQAFVRVERPRG